MKETVNPFDVMSSASCSTYSFLLQNITHCAISKKINKTVWEILPRFENNSIKVSNFHSALFTGKKYCLIPSRVSFSF